MIVLITGASAGFGQAMARKFVKEGHRVIAAARRAERLQHLHEELGDALLPITLDVTDKTMIEQALADLPAAWTPIDVLINNAGITQAVKTLDIDTASWNRIMDVNLRGVLYLSQAVIPQMKKQKSGSIACTSSVSAQRGGGILGGPHYSAAKAGVLGLAKAMAREFGIDGIRVNCVTPGLILTDINAGKIPENKRGEILAGIPLNREGVANDVAGAFTFLASDLSAYITGAVIDVNGGMWCD